MTTDIVGNIFDLHDFEIFEIFNSDRSISLKLKFDNKIYSYTFTDVYFLEINEWRIQNVILDVEIRDISVFSIREFIFTSKLHESTINNGIAEKIFGNLSENKYICTKIIPSAGADICIISKYFKLTQIA